MRYLGIDYGTKRVGIALSDEAGIMGFPEGVLPNDDILKETLMTLIAKEHVGGIVMGESLDFQGAENAVAAQARAFAEDLSSATGVPVHFEPEVFTTQAARRDPEGVHMQGGIVDAAAAAIILSSFLARVNPRPDPREEMDM